MALRSLFIILFSFTFAFTSWAEEKISSYDVHVDVQKNGDFIVTETIAVTVEGNDIRRGIFRDIPRYLKDGEYKVPQRFHVLSVKRDGKKEKYKTSNEGNARRIRIGNADRLLPLGAHVYELKYRAKNQVRYSDEFDEVYWNATGTFWKFKIDTVTTTVTFPDDIQIIEQNAYTGRQGQTGADYTYSDQSNSHIFKTTRPFDRYEGITVSLTFPKNRIDPLTASELGFLWWIKHAALLIMSFSLFGILGFYIRSWNKVGRDPVKGPVFPRYQAPDGYSPAAVSHIHFKGLSKNRALIATLVNLGIKHYLEIDSGKKKTVLKLKKQSNEKELTNEESLLLKKMFPGRNDILTLDGDPHTRFNSAHDKFRDDIRGRFSKDYYRPNYGYMVFGLFASIAGAATAGTFMFGDWRPAYSIIVVGLILTNILFFVLMPAPTQKGQQRMSEIKGFKLYLETAEKLQLNATKIGSETPPMMTTERYERFLPYAIALGVEKPWSKYFQSVVPAEAKEYAPHWSGSNFNSRSIDRSLGSMVSNMSSGVTSAAPQASSSSGGGGGGFSGGGGGGGGGGGW